MGAYLRGLSTTNASKVEVLHVAISSPQADLEAVGAPEDLKVPDGLKLIVTAARLAPQKDLPTLIEAVASVPDAFLAIVGDGPLRGELEEAIDRAGLRDRVCLLGFRPDAYRYVRAADVFCLSSTWEAVSLAAQEAAAVGTPIVATDVGGIGELVVDGVSGRLVPARDPIALAAALREVLESPEKAKSFAAAARTTLDEGFGRDVMLDRLADIYMEAAHV
jgi:glycosyltransferase involved in cell wall biosynthesis